MLHFNESALLLVLLACLATCCATCAAADAPTTRPVVVVELFTSEGCSSCPPADAVLADLARPDAVDGVEIIPLALHVDYWNRLGWADRFSTAKFSDRQQQYARSFNSDQVYTPQMIVDGTEEFVGSDRRKADAAIARSAARAKGRIIIDAVPDFSKENLITWNISIADVAGIGNSGAQVMLAITEDDLSTNVPRGENAGRTLRHTAVVRTLEQVATIRPADALPFSASAKTALEPTWRADHLHAIFFVQGTLSRRILAAAQQPIAAQKAIPAK